MRRILAIAAGALALGAAASHAQSPPRSGGSRGEAARFEDYRIILDRNIFDPTRRPPRPDQPVEERREAPPPPAPEQRIGLSGVLLIDDRAVGFFTVNGDTGDPVETGTEIAGCLVEDLSTSGALLVCADQRLALPVGRLIKRRGDEPWAVSEERIQVASRPSAPPSSSSSSSSYGRPDDRSSNDHDHGDRGEEMSGGERSMLERMMERRRRESGD